jgi:hypothetical protein
MPTPTGVSEDRWPYPPHRDVASWRLGMPTSEAR